MKHIYTRAFIFAFVIVIGIWPHKVYSQCSNGSVPSGVAFDTTFTFTSGHHSSELKFPKFDPQAGMVTCARLTMELSGTLNTLRFENIDATPNIATASFTRNDTMTGPGLPSPMLNAETQNYGPYVLQPADATPNAGDDYIGIGPELIFNRTVSVVITDAAVLSLFYGPAGDSLIYNYNVNSKTSTLVSGNWLGGVITSGSVTYRLEYCYCPIELLPVNAFDFNAKKVDDDKVQLSWKSNNDLTNYYYEVEYSTDGSIFTRADIVEKQTTSSETISYNYLFIKNNFKGKYYFRVRQKFTTGKTLITEIKSVDFGELKLSSFSLYPNPSNGIIGIKFDNNTAGKVLVLVTNIQGQTIINKEIELFDNNYRQVGTLQRGVYWVKVTDVTSRRSWVSQLLIK